MSEPSISAVSSTVTISRPLMITCSLVWMGLILTSSSCQRKSGADAGEDDSPPPVATKTYQKKTLGTKSEGLLRIIGQLSKSEYDATDTAQIKVDLDALDETELLKVLEELGNSTTRKEQSIRYMTLLKLSELNPELALEKIAMLTKGALPYGLKRFVDEAVKSDANAVMRWLKTAGQAEGAVLSELRSFAIAELAEQSPDIALQATLTLKGHDRRRSQDLLFYHMAKQDAREALSLANSKLSGEDLERAHQSIINGLTTRSPQLALDLVTGLDSDDLASRTLPNIFATWLTKDPEKSVQALRSLPTGSLRQVLESRIALNRLVDSGPQAARDVISSIVLTSSSKDLYHDATRLLMASDSEATLEWIGSLPESQERSNLTTTAYSSLISGESPAFVEALLQGTSESREELLNAVAKWGTSKPKDGLSLAYSLSARERPSFLNDLLNRSAAQAPRETIEVLREAQDRGLIDLNTDNSSLMVTIGTSYAQQDLDAARKWADSVPSSIQDSAIYGLVSGWATRDVEAVAEWLGSLDPGRRRNAGIRALVEQIRNTDPEAAGKWQDLLVE